MVTLVLDADSFAALLGALVSLLAAAWVFPLGRVEGWEDLRPLGWVSLTAFAVCGARLAVTVSASPAVVVWSSRAHALFVALHALAWAFYLIRWARRPGAEFRRAHVACVAALLLAGAHDAVALAGLKLPTPPLLDAAVVAAVVFLALATLHRLSGNVADLNSLRSSLEAEHWRLLDEGQAALEDSERRLASAQAEQRAALGQAERLASVGRFSAGLARELKHAAAASARGLERLARGLPGEREDLARPLEEARAGLQEVVALAAQLVLAGRSRAAALAPVRLASVIDPALATARARAEDRAVLRVTVPGELWVVADAQALVQALSNLAVNSVRAIPVVRSGTVAVQAEAQGDRVRILVEDDGIGMSEEELLHVFEPFHGAKPPGMGSGIGLAVARTLVESMQGTLRFESAMGRGSRAVLELARAAPGVREAPPPPARPAGARSPGSASEAPRAAPGRASLPLGRLSKR